MAKSKVMVFRKGGPTPRNLHLELNDTNIEIIVNSYKYLGVEFQPSGVFTKNAKRVSYEASLQNHNKPQVIAATYCIGVIGQTGVVLLDCLMLRCYLVLLKCVGGGVTNIEVLAMVQSF